MVTQHWTDGCPVGYIEVPHKPAEEVFRLVEVAEKREKIARLDDFLTSVSAVSLTSLSLERVLSDAEQFLDKPAMDELRDIMQEIQ